LTRQLEVREDNYLLGGEVERFEQHWAALLGKEAAVFMPSGTLANQLALRALAGHRRRVIVPEMSHVYNDTGDACQTLSSLTLIPLAPGAASFTRADVEAVLARTASGRVAADVGAILIESPIRRLFGQMFDWDEAKRITAFARERGIGTHLDGARLFIASAYTGISPVEYAAPFDTVYVSLWKYFNSGIGAILAGPKRVLDGMFHVRRMFGGNLAVGWPATLVARHYMDGFLDRLKSAVRVSEDFYTAIARHPKVSVSRIPNGTNVTRLTLKGANVAAVRKKLLDRHIEMPGGSPDGVVTLGVNETWNRTSGTELAVAFEQARIVCGPSTRCTRSGHSGLRARATRRIACRQRGPKRARWPAIALRTHLGKRRPGSLVVNVWVLQQRQLKAVSNRHSLGTQGR
jgi:threonine aldolase